MNPLPKKLEALINEEARKYADHMEVGLIASEAKRLGCAHMMGAHFGASLVLKEAMALAEALIFYGSPFGPHQGTVNENTNIAIMTKLNQNGELARQALTRWQEFLSEEKEVGE